ncbi:SGNH/GDSL hydrolase family protein [Mucilaginibacter calamicampi]|uniref:SGNH/GDSL hydrolase family protein n=1 Tax=Mucilaginibacter calamicampi TaxID=1302352 RepID=A0ABW2YVW6_9SPHI
MKTIFSFLLLVIALSGCAKKSEFDDPIDPNGLYINPTAKYLALGDSYTVGQSIPLDQSFPYQLTRLLGREQTGDPTIIAATGWTTTNLIYAIDGSGVLDKKFDVVTLLIGVNDQYQGVSATTYSNNFTKLLNTAISFADNKPKRVFVLSIPDYSVTPYAASSDKAQIAAQIDQFNAINKQITLAAGVSYLDITDISRKANQDADLIAGDGLHPSAKMYSLWMERLEPLVRSALSQ